MDDSAPSDYAQWLGQVTHLDDTIAPTPLRLLSATLDRGDPPPVCGSTLPPSWHWLFFLPAEPQSTIAADGHPRRGGFLPPIPLPRRMWAGSRIAFLRSLAVGQSLRRTSTIRDIRSKHGRTGELVFVRVRHEIGDDQGIAISEDQDIVYRALPSARDLAPAGRLARSDEQFSRTITPDPVMLFRYSALTFNGHRIHYDRSYATDVEGYPGLVVHGPLIATLLLDLLRREHPGATVSDFQFRALSPLFDIEPFTVCGRVDGQAAILWARNARGGLAMESTATFA